MNGGTALSTIFTVIIGGIYAQIAKNLEQGLPREAAARFARPC